MLLSKSSDKTYGKKEASKIPLKGDPVSSLAALNNIYGFRVRREILSIRSNDDLMFVDKQTSNILSKQKKNGSWNDSIIDTAGNINLLLDYGIPPSLPEIDKAKAWLLSRQNTGHPYYEGLFLEDVNSNHLQKKYVSYEPLFAPSNSFCCYPNTTIATSCVLQVFFRTGEDVSSNDRLGLAVDKVITLGNMAHGICAGNIEQLTTTMRMLEASRKIHQRHVNRKLGSRHELWDREDNMIFRRSSEENPGTQYVLISSSDHYPILQRFYIQHT